MLTAGPVSGAEAEARQRDQGGDAAPVAALEATEAC